MGFPKHMYNGYYTDNEIVAEELIVNDEKQEARARKAGFQDGHAFFGVPPQPVKPKEKK